MTSPTPLFVGLGEVLWDLLPAGKQLGGAPANVACHARTLGAEAFIVSAIGEDDAGKELERKLSARGIDTRFLQVHRRYPTGSVAVATDDAGQPHYTIAENVAWDFMNWDDALAELALAADAICYGTLAQRCFISRSTLTAFIQHTRPECLRIFDVNLRQGFHSPELLDTTLQLSNILKLNEQEWPLLAEALQVDPSLPNGLASLLSRYSLRLIALTQGANGSLLLTPETTHHQPAEPVTIRDTVGAGDAFTAALALGLLRGLPLEKIHAHASRLAAYVCTQRGATPDIPKELRQA